MGQRTVVGGHILDTNARNERLSPRGDQPLSETADSDNDVTFSLNARPRSYVTANPRLCMLR
jgi:hypothetical protein